MCQSQIQGLLKDFQGPYEEYIKRTKLNQTGTYTSIGYISVVSSPSGVRAKPRPKMDFMAAHLRSERSHLEHLFSISTGSVTAFEKIEFKDCQGPARALFQRCAYSVIRHSLAEFEP